MAPTWPEKKDPNSLENWKVEGRSIANGLCGPKALLETAIGLRLRGERAGARGSREKEVKFKVNESGFKFIQIPSPAHLGCSFYFFGR